MRDGLLSVTPKILVGSADAHKVRVALLNTTTTDVMAKLHSRTVALRISVTLTLEDFGAGPTATGTTSGQGTKARLVELMRMKLAANSADSQYTSMKDSYLSSDVKSSMNAYNQENEVRNTPDYSAAPAEISGYQTFATSDSAAPTGTFHYYPILFTIGLAKNYHFVNAAYFVSI